MRGSAAFRTGVAPGGALAGPWVRNPLWTAARAVPSLDLCFAANKSLVDATTGQNLVTFTRASSGTYVDSQGVIQRATTNEPRFDHNPTTGESLGLLVEESRTNLLLRSEEFDNASWTKVAGSVTANAITAPDGQTTADLFTEDSNTAQHDVRVTSPTLTDATTYTFSIYARANGRQLQIIYPLNTAGHGAVFNLTNGTFTLVGNTVSASIQPVGAGWYRCICTATKSGGTGTSTLRILTNNGTTNSYTGDGTSGIYLWGAQLEAGAFPTSYIPTTTAAATRAADVASISGSNFSSWYRQDEGTVFAEIDQYAGGSPVTSANYGIFGFSNGNFGTGVHVFVGAGGAPVLTVQNSGTQAYLSSGGLTPSAINKIAGAYKTNDFARSANGASVVIDTSGTVPTALTQADVGKLASVVNQLNGTIRRLVFWPTRLPNETLQGITQ